MERRKFFTKLGLGSAAAVVTAPLLARGLAAGQQSRGSDDQESQGHHDHDPRPLTGALASATVSFGAWQSQSTTPPGGLDRYPPPPMGPPPGNVHKLIPYQVTIKVGGTVNFIIAGLHQIIVYAPGKRPDEVGLPPLFPTRPTKGLPPAVPLINDPRERLYAGLDPSTLHGGPPTEAGNPPLLDRIEVVQFTRRGRHLVICGVLPHFVNDNMYGWVNVVGGDD
jgi:hypothetical protein